MNRDEKAVAIAEIANQIEQANAIFAVDYRGISVPEAAELRSRLRDADATFKVVKNSLTERAADRAGAETLKAFLSGPTALTFVRGDVAVAAKAIADQARATQLLPFKGGLMDGAELAPEEIRAISRLPSREALYGQLVGVVASPVSGLVRSLAALVSGFAVALGQIQERKESGELPAGEPPAAETPAKADEAPAPVEAAEAGEPHAEEPAGDEAAAPTDLVEAGAAPAEGPAAEEPAGDGAHAEADEAGQPGAEKAEPEQDEPAQEDDNQADVSAEAESGDAESPTKED